MIEAGIYKAHAVQAALGESSQGKEQVAVEFETLDDEGAAGPHITWFGSFSDKAIDITIKALRTCGWTGTDLSDLSGVETNEVQLVIEHEEYNGKTSAKVKWVNALGGLALKTPLTAEKAKVFGAKMRGKVAAADMANGQPRKPSNGKARGEPPPHSDADSDIPF